MVLNIPYKVVNARFFAPLRDREGSDLTLIPVGAVIIPFGGGAKIESMVYFHYDDKEYETYRWRFEQCTDQAHITGD